MATYPPNASGAPGKEIDMAATEKAATVEQAAAVEKVIVAVHGIGDQKRFVTIRQVLTQFCLYRGEIAAVPLGNFHSSEGPLVLPNLPELAFAEVYWADIARSVVERKYDLEDTKPWIKTLLGRVRREKLTPTDLSAKDQLMVEQVIGEMLETIGVLDRLCFLADKMGIFSFDLKKVLENYLGDVQIVADFKSEGKNIGARFAERMQAIHKQYPNADIYLVAHSEGTVVSFLGLLSALCSEEGGWIEHVRGFMTFGSPIDKHLALWPELFAGFQRPCSKWQTSGIIWKNYYDYGDPVGFELDGARKRFTEGPWKGVFDFPEVNDHGFTRYPLPGKAHNDYWQDDDVFGHFIQTVVYKNPPKPKCTNKAFDQAPSTKWLSWGISWFAPYLGAFALLFCAVLILYRVVTGAATADSQGPAGANAADTILNVSRQVLGITFLIAGLTVLGRIPRLTRMKRWRVFGVVFFALTVFAYRILICAPSSLVELRDCLKIDRLSGLVGIAVVLAIVVSLVGLVPSWGMRGLLVPGSFGVAYALYLHLAQAHLSIKELWPVVLASLVFLYLWWLVALLFDLVFVWHRYIRYSSDVGFLRRREV